MKPTVEEAFARMARNIEQLEIEQDHHRADAMDRKALGLLKTTMEQMKSCGNCKNSYHSGFDYPFEIRCAKNCFEGSIELFLKMNMKCKGERWEIKE